MQIDLGELLESNQKIRERLDKEINKYETEKMQNESETTVVTIDSLIELLKELKDIAVIKEYDD